MDSHFVKNDGNDLENKGKWEWENERSKLA